MAVVIFFYVLGMILTALFIRNSNKGLLSKKLEEKNALTGAIILWPLFLIACFIGWCENLAKKGN